MSAFINVQELMGIGNAIAATRHPQDAKRDAITSGSWDDFEAEHPIAAEKISNQWVMTSAFDTGMAAINEACASGTYNEMRTACQQLFNARRAYRASEMEKHA